ncbi:MAG: trimethylamine methyltransferase [Desulfobacteraceae bacterium]|nr:trimethylamine methyltransferase [Desulfobacteraceae bacterium]
MKEKLKKIYSHSLAILKEVGILLRHEEILKILKENGVKIEDKTAFFSPDQIETWVSKAPQIFTFKARNPIYDAVIGGSHRQFASGYGCPRVYEMDGTSRESTLKDYVRFAQLVHQSPYFNINGGILAQPCDVPANLSHLIMVYSALQASDKCLMGLPGNQEQMTQLMEMAAIVFGGKKQLAKHPRILTMISTLSPLQMDNMALSSILVSARLNQPLIMSPAPGAGTTGPIDMAGNLAMATAEALAGIAVAQVIRPGTPVLFGIHCFGADLRTCNIAIGSPAYSLQAKYTAALARMLNLPSRCGGATTDALCASPQSGYESMFSLVNACQNGSNLIVHSSGVLDSFAAISYEKFIMDQEMLDMVQYYFNDLEVTDDSLNLDLIKDVGPGGQFLTHMDTLKKCRTHSWNPLVGVRGNISPKKALEKYYENIKAKMKDMFAAYKKPEIDPDIHKDLDEYMIQQGVPEEILDSVQNFITFKGE